MTTSIDAAIAELDIYQRDLEDLVAIIRNPETNRELSPILKRCFEFRMGFFRRNIETLITYIENELDKQPFNYNLIEQ
jgi:hypothetical protein